MASTATPGPAPNVASTMARTHQEHASSKAPAVSDKVPSEVSARPRSLMMRASIGNAVSAMHAPMNSVAFVGEMPAANRPGTFSSSGVMRKAMKNGAAMPAIDTPTALRALDWKWFSCRVVPTRNMYRPTPSCAPV